MFIATKTNRRKVLTAALNATTSSDVMSNASVLLRLLILVLDLNAAVSLVSGSRVEYIVSVNLGFGRSISIVISARGLELVVLGFFFLCRLIFNRLFFNGLLGLRGWFLSSRPRFPSRDDHRSGNPCSGSQAV